MCQARYGTRVHGRARGGHGLACVATAGAALIVWRVRADSLQIDGRRLHRFAPLYTMFLVLGVFDFEVCAPQAPHKTHCSSPRHLLLYPALLVCAAQLLRAPSDVSRVTCALCGEPIEMFWDGDAAEWMMRDAIGVADGQYAHTSCAA